jgi:hypothetical protein
MTDHDKKLLALIRDLAQMVRELMPVNERNIRRQTEFGERLRNFLEGREQGS